MTAAMPDGRVISLWRYPVLGMAGEHLRSTQIDPRGVAGDRLHYATGPAGRLTQDELPGLGTWAATFPFNPDGAIIPANSPPYPVVIAPGGARLLPLGRPAAGPRDRARPSARGSNSCATPRRFAA